MSTQNATRSYWGVVLLAAAVLMVTMGSRQSQGLFMSPLNTSTGVGIVNISLAMAIGQFVWGAVQPIAGAVADRYGPGRVLAVGIILLALGSAITPFMTSPLGLIFSLGILIAAGSGAGSFSVLIGSAARHMPPEKRGMAAGIINAGGSFGQFVRALRSIDRPLPARRGGARHSAVGHFQSQPRRPGPGLVLWPGCFPRDRILSAAGWAQGRGPGSA